jgi:prefoldin subunit 5
MDKYGKYAITQIKRFESQILEINNKIQDITTYIQTLEGAGFTSDELIRQLEQVTELNKVTELINSIKDRNVLGLAGISDRIFRNDDVARLETRSRRITNPNTGLLIIKNRARNETIGTYEARSSAVSITTERIGPDIKMTFEFTDGLTYDITLENHTIQGLTGREIEEQGVAYMTFVKVQNTVRLQPLSLFINLEAKEYSAYETQGVVLQLDEFMRMLRSMPQGMTVVTDAVGMTVAPLESHNRYVEEYIVDELVRIFKIQLQQVSEDMQGQGLAGSYGQAAITAMSQSNNILESAIVSVDADYEYTLGESKDVIASVAKEPNLSGTYAEKSIPTDLTKRYYPMSTEYGSQPNSTVVVETVRPAFKTSSPVINDIVNRVRVTDLSEDDVALNVELTRTTPLGQKSIACEIRIEVRPSTLTISDMVSHVGFIQPNGTSTTSSQLEYAGIATHQQVSTSSIAFLNMEYVTMNTTSDVRNHVAVVGARKTVSEETYMVAEIDASTILDIGGSTEYNARFNFTYDGVDFDQTIVMSRQYISDMEGTQRLVYRGEIMVGVKSGTAILGYAAKMSNDVPVKRTLNWAVSRMNQTDPQSTDTSFTIQTGAGLSSYPVTEDKLARRPIKMGRDIVLTPICHTNLSVPTGFENRDVFRNAFVPSFSGYNYPSNNDAVIIGGRARPDSIIGPSPSQWFINPQITNYQTGNSSRTITIPDGNNSSVTLLALTMDSNQEQTVRQLTEYNSVTYFMGIRNLRLNSMTMLSVREMALPTGVYSNQKISEDVRRLWSTVDLLREYSSILNEHIQNLDSRVTMVEETLERVIEAIEEISSTLNDLIVSLQPKPDPWGKAGGILGFVSGAVGLFFPIIGTALGVVSQIVVGVGQLLDGDISGGITELVLGSLAAGLGVYKFGKRMMNKFERRTDVKTNFNVKDAGVTIGTSTMLKGSSNVPEYSDKPPSYDEIFGTSMKNKPMSGRLVTSDIETKMVGNEKRVINEEVMLQVYNPSTHTEWERLSLRLTGLGFSGLPSNVVFENRRLREFNEAGFQLSREDGLYVVYKFGDHAERQELTSVEYAELVGGGQVSTDYLNDIEFTYARLDSVDITYPMERDLLLPMLMSCALDPVPQVPTTYKCLVSANEVIKPVTFRANPLNAYQFVKSTNKDSLASRELVERMIDYSYRTDLTLALTDVYIPS